MNCPYCTSSIKIIDLDCGKDREVGLCDTCFRISLSVIIVEDSGVLTEAKISSCKYLEITRNPLYLGPADDKAKPYIYDTLVYSADVDFVNQKTRFYRDKLFQKSNPMFVLSGVNIVTPTSFNDFIPKMSLYNILS